eukprot:9229225-Alexandrium_andersonii.AAC.1
MHVATGLEGSASDAEDYFKIQNNGVYMVRPSPLSPVARPGLASPTPGGCSGRTGPRHGPKR